MVNTIYSCGGYRFESAKDLADFKIQFPDEWKLVKDSPLKLSGLYVSSYDELIDYLNSLQDMPDIYLAYQVDRARGYGFYTRLWVNGLEVNGIFGYYESNSILEMVDEVDQFVSQSKWNGLKIRTKLCR